MFQHVHAPSRKDFHSERAQNAHSSTSQPLRGGSILPCHCKRGRATAAILWQRQQTVYSPPFASPAPAPGRGCHPMPTARNPEASGTAYVGWGGGGGCSVVTLLSRSLALRATIDDASALSRRGSVDSLLLPKTWPTGGQALAGARRRMHTFLPHSRNSCPFDLLPFGVPPRNRWSFSRPRIIPL